METLENKEKKEIRWGQVIDLDKCTSCQACSFACAAENSTPITTEEETKSGKWMGWHMVLTDMVKGEYPNKLNQELIPRPCMHCENAPCVKVCPVGATFKGEGGLTMQDSSRCIGCRFCMNACPYGVRVFNWFDSNDEERWPEPLDKSINPENPPRPKGTVEKCTFNRHRLEFLRYDLKAGTAPKYIYDKLKGRYQPGEEVTDEIWSEAMDIVMRYKYYDEATPENFDPKMVSYLPACVQACSPKVIVFGDLNNPESLISEKKNSPRAFRLLEELGTEPSVYYLKRKS